MTKLKILPKQIRFLMWVKQHKSNEITLSEINRIKWGLAAGTYKENGLLQWAYNQLRKNYMEEFKIYNG